MGEARAVPFAGREKWGEVAGNLVIVVVGGVVAAGVLIEVPPDVVAMRVLGWYTAAGVAVTFVLVLALVGTRRLPTLQRATLEGRPALAVRSWPGTGGNSNVLDLGLGVLGIWLAVLGLRAGEDLVVPALLVGAPGVWFLVRVALAVAGRRRNEALWLTDEELVHDRASGRERCRRAAVVGLNRFPGTAYLVLDVDGGADQRLCPRPWRKGRRVAGAGDIVVDCSSMGHDAGDLAEWLSVSGELALGDRPVVARRGTGVEVEDGAFRFDQQGRRVVRLSTQKGQVSRQKWPGPFLTFSGTAGAVFSLVLGTLLVLDAETLFGGVFATGFVIAGACVILSLAVRVSEGWWISRLPPPRREKLNGEETDFHPRRTGWPTPAGYLIPGSLGLWAAAVAVVGAVEENWGWPVLFAVPTIYFLGFPVLWLLGRFRPAGVWLTPTRVVNEHFGLRSELAVRDISTLIPWSSELVVMPHEGTAVEHRKLTPKWWRARLKEDRLVINTEHMFGGSEGLTADLQRLLDSRSRR